MHAHTHIYLFVHCNIAIMSQKIHVRSPLLGKHTYVEDETVLTAHYSNAAVDYSTQRPRSAFLDTQSAVLTSGSLAEIPVEDDSWVGGRRPEKRRRDTIFGYILLIVALAMFTAQTVSYHCYILYLFTSNNYLFIHIGSYQCFRDTILS
jgi:hypothetical protein